MANIKLEDLPEGVRKGVKLIAKYGGSGDDYWGVYNQTLKQENFFYDLSNFIEQKKYKNILYAINEQFSWGLNLDDKTVSDDEKLIRRSLREFGFHEDDFFNPKFDKDELIAYTDRSGQEKVYKVDYAFKDNGAYYYNLRDLESGTQVGGRLPQSEIKEPSILQYMEYYKKQGTLDVHLFNKFCPVDKVTFEEKMELLDAIKGIDVESKNENIREIAHIAQGWRGKEAKELIDFTTHFNLVAMLADSHSFENNPINLKLPSDETTVNEILDMEKFAKKQMEVIEKYRIVREDILDIKKELKYQSNLNPENEKLKKTYEDSTFSVGYDSLDLNAVGKLYGTAHWYIKNDNPNLYKKIDDLYSKTIDFIQERDMYKLNRPDLNDLIKSAGMIRDLKRKDIVIFRGISRNADFEYHNVKDNLKDKIKSDAVELNIANNGFRREIYQAPCETHGGSNFSYCEGDLSLVVPKNKEDFEKRLDSSIKFYIEEEGIERYTQEDVKNEMIAKLVINNGSIGLDDAKDAISGLTKELVKPLANQNVK